jgi:sugar O-acyltransferase (sialic acid O-acetyltransferase NeuD family)
MSGVTNDSGVLILGAGGTGVDVADWLSEKATLAGSLRCIGFLDDDANKWGAEIHELRVLGPLALVEKYPGAMLVNAIGSPSNFALRPQLLPLVPAGRFVTLIHRHTQVSRRAHVGHGVLIYPSVVVSPDVHIGAHVTILPHVVVNHDVVIGDYSIIASSVSLSGGVRVGSRCYIGAGSHLIQGAAVGDGSLVGMGSVVIRDVPADTIVVGNPAKVLKDHQSHA